MDWIIWAVIGGILAIVAIFFIATHNGFVRLRNKCEEAYATMDVYLKKRHDIVPNLVEVTKQYAAHEKDTLEQVISARSRAMGSASPGERAQSENELTGTLRSLFALSESYPELKADRMFLDLQQQLSALEQDVAQARKYYNGVVRQTNNKIESFPSNIVAGMMGIRRYAFFEADAQERQSVHVKF